jgi:hypothetical protein
LSRWIAYRGWSETGHFRAQLARAGTPIGSYDVLTGDVRGHAAAVAPGRAGHTGRTHSRSDAGFSENAPEAAQPRPFLRNEPNSGDAERYAFGLARTTPLGAITAVDQNAFLIDDDRVKETLRFDVGGEVGQLTSHHHATASPTCW